MKELNGNQKSLFIGAIVVLILAFAFFALGSAFGKVDKILWCHTEPNGNSQTLELPQQALEQAGHVDASGNPLHAGDYAGECIVSPTVSPTPSVEPSSTPTPSATPTVTPTPTSAPDLNRPVEIKNEQGQTVILPPAPLSK